ncbi:hypothetical protein ACPW96_21735 [Micromonospora sp. DT81.3]|uniref:hypothetical protein n=1 Tax=Micromonospora sp. DT81.3 TaxID=3416523 RepID=UPI003CEE2B5B
MASLQPQPSMLSVIAAAVIGWIELGLAGLAAGMLVASIALSGTSGPSIGVVVGLVVVVLAFIGALELVRRRMRS